MATIGQNIRNARKAAGLTQKALGAKCNMPDSQIRQYELGMVNPKLEQIKRIATALNIPLQNLIGSELLSLSDSVIELFSGSEVKDLGCTDPSSPLENYLVTKFRELNEKGRNKVVDYTDDLSKTIEYTEKKGE